MVTTIAMAAMTTATAQAEVRRPAFWPTMEMMPTPVQAERTIEITPQTQWVNVKRMEVVQVVSTTGGSTRTFTWSFTARTLKPFSLSEIVPAGFVDQPVTVYVAPGRLSR
jgi:hypothetical protein